MSFTLTRPRTAIVEVVRLSGMTESGIFVLDHDNAKNMRGDAVSLLYRVIQPTPDCRYLKPGAVYQVINPYNYSVICYEGVDYFVMHEDNFSHELEGYDGDSSVDDEDNSDVGYPVCGK